MISGDHGIRQRNRILLAPSYPEPVPVGERKGLPYSPAGACIEQQHDALAGAASFDINTEDIAVHQTTLIHISVMVEDAIGTALVTDHDRSVDPAEHTVPCGYNHGFNLNIIILISAEGQLLFVKRPQIYFLRIPIPFYNRHFIILKRSAVKCRSFSPAIAPVRSRLCPAIHFIKTIIQIRPHLYQLPFHPQAVPYIIIAECCFPSR